MLRFRLLNPTQYRSVYSFSNVIKTKEKVQHIGEPLITCKRSEFNLYRGDKRIEEAKFGSIPLASDGWHHFRSKNDHFIIHPHLSAEDELQHFDNQLTFDKFGIDQNLLLNLSSRLNMDQTTFIQQQAIPHVLANHHTLIAAETGCGKTMAYLLPIIQKVLKIKQEPREEETIKFNTPKVLIITPGRELANQIGEVLEDLCHGLDIKTKVIIGGHTKSLMNNPPIDEVDVLVASLGALSKLITTNIYRMHQVQHVVLDEADTLLDDSFGGKLQYVLKRFPVSLKKVLLSQNSKSSLSFQFYKNVQKNKSPTEIGTQLILASATMPSNIDESLQEIIDTSTIHEAVSPFLHKVMPHITQKFLRIRKSHRPIELLGLVKTDVEKKRPVIVFSNKHETSDYISILLNDNGIDAVSLNKSSIEKVRRQQFKKFQSGLVNVLSTTDLASRGLDTTRVSLLKIIAE